MIGFRDMTFCPFHETCHNPCYRALTDEVKKSAERWWGGPDAPIARFVEKPNCHDPPSDGA